MPTFRELIDSYKAGRSAWESAGSPVNVPIHRDMMEADRLLVRALNVAAGNDDKIARSGECRPATVLDDDGTVYLVVDNDWGQVPCISPFLPVRSSAEVP